MADENEEIVNGLPVDEKKSLGQSDLDEVLGRVLGSGGNTEFSQGGRPIGGFDPTAFTISTSGVATPIESPDNSTDNNENPPQTSFEFVNEEE